MNRSGAVPTPAISFLQGKAAWIPVALIGAIWFPAFSRCAIDWSVNPQYYFGWFVPLLAGYLYYERLATQPVPESPANPRAVLWLIALLAAPQLPLRWLSEANSTSRLITWAMALSAAGISISLLYLAGGRAFARHFLPPIIFLLVAVPWPIQIETPVVQGLMRTNAHWAAEVINIAGVPAEARGNVIEVPGGLLGVNEACSGIRSLQSTLMAAIFLGFLYRASLRGCLFLIVCGIGIALGCNFIRTVFLTWEGAFHGIQATEKWHDSAGFAILLVVLISLWCVSRFLEKRSSPGRAS
ncbi:MAG: exosortase/archaeosortase family protein [Terrimicrobiaceae bacterium]|nr:exosortase/archaeosortase family protein [Terrimicrobiaceae bacterium]